MQRHLLYLGEINDSQKAAWTKLTEVFDPQREQTRPLALYPADRAVPAHAAEYGVQVRLSEFVLRRPRQWGGCWVGCQLWDQLHLDEFWRERLADSREGTCGCHVLQQMDLSRDQLLLKLGAAKAQYPAVWRLVHTQVPKEEEPVNTQTFTLMLRTDK